MKLYRVFPYDSDAAPDERGGALYRPRSSKGRIDNPDLYHALYLASHPEGAIAETFGRLPIWQASDFTHAYGRPYALATYEIAEPATIFNLDDIDALRGIGIQNPTTVITRDRLVTQAWARRIYLQGGYLGASWWCYYNPAFISYGLWDISSIIPAGEPESLHVDSPYVGEAARLIVRQIVEQ